MGGGSSKVHPGGPSDDEHIGSSNAPPQPRHGVGYSVLLLGDPYLSRICVVTKSVLASQHLQ